MRGCSEYKTTIGNVGIGIGIGAHIITIPIPTPIPTPNVSCVAGCAICRGFEGGGRDPCAGGLKPAADQAIQRAMPKAAAAATPPISVVCIELTHGRAPVK